MLKQPVVCVSRSRTHKVSSHKSCDRLSGKWSTRAKNHLPDSGISHDVGSFAKPGGIDPLDRRNFNRVMRASMSFRSHLFHCKLFFFLPCELASWHLYRDIPLKDFKWMNVYQESFYLLFHFFMRICTPSKKTCIRKYLKFRILLHAKKKMLVISNRLLIIRLSVRRPVSNGIFFVLCTVKNFGKFSYYVLGDFS